MLYLSVIFHLIHVCSYIDIPSWKNFLMYSFEISHQVLHEKFQNDIYITKSFIS